MSYLDPNHGIHIIAGDTWEMDLRLFNRSWHIHREPSNIMKIKIYPLLPLIELDSEGEPQFVFNSEGYPVYNVDSEGRPYWYDPTLPLPRDSEGNLIIDPSKIISTEIKPRKRLPWPKWPNVEVPIKHWDKITLKVIDVATKEVVLEKYNDEFPNSIFFLKEDTNDLKPKIYMYSLIYEPFIPDLDDEDLEKDTVITGLFEIIDKF